MEGQMTIFDFPEYLPDEIIPVSIRGLMDDGYCPKCDEPLNDLVEVCPECNTKLDWTFWRKLNEQ